MGRGLVKAVDDGRHYEGLLGGLLLFERLRQLNKVVLCMHGRAAALLVVDIIRSFGAIVAVGAMAMAGLARVGVIEQEADGM